MNPDIDYGVYLVTDSRICRGRELVDVVREAVLGGVTVVQFREKECGTGEFIDRARRLKELLDTFDVPLIINDRVEAALEIGAHGVHIGQGDMPYAQARRILGPRAVIGLTVKTLDQVVEAETLDVDYLGIGPVLPTQTKPDAGSPWGFSGLRRAADISRHKLVAIGSMNPENAGRAIAAGAHGVAVVSAVCAAASPADAARDLRRAVAMARGQKGAV